MGWTKTIFINNRVTTGNRTLNAANATPCRACTVVEAVDVELGDDLLEKLLLLSRLLLLLALQVLRRLLHDQLLQETARLAGVSSVSDETAQNYWALNNWYIVQATRAMCRSKKKQVLSIYVYKYLENKYSARTNSMQRGHAILTTWSREILY